LLTIHPSSWIAEFRFSITLYPRVKKKPVEIGLLRETMNTNSKKNGPISRKQPLRPCSVVGKNRPLVGSTFPTDLALVGQKRPPVVNRRQSGFTLLELMIVLAVAAILVSIAIPNMRTFIQDGRLTSQANDFVTDINVARSHAIHRPATVVICPSATGAACLPLGSNWEGGRLIFVDGDGDSTCCSGLDERLRYREALSTANTQRTAAVDPDIDPMVFSGEGLLTSGGGAFTFNLCDERGTAHGRVVSVTRTQVRVAPKTTLPASCP
jgi:type IV fimbrial biogenesis protein FimT